LNDLASTIENNVAAALGEDIGSGDLTAQLVAGDGNATAKVICRDKAVICGASWFDACFRRLDSQSQIDWVAGDGSSVEPGQLLCTVRGAARALLTAERTALNFLQLLSAVASTTRSYVDAVAGTQTTIVDTRKTVPGLRLAQKYAVRVGGGSNHRLGLYDAILIKENHIAAAGSISRAISKAKSIAPPGVWIQVEVENEAQLKLAIASGATMILLDNMSLAQMREAVRVAAGRAQLEASGGVSLATVRAVAETGVHRISIGGLTKDIKAVDLSMRFE
jgi:nicotinate-nucleotide pyrophosphorylase (carboxylating)